MEALLQAYSSSEIMTFLVMLAVAIKGAVSFCDWAKDRLRKISNKEYKRMSKEEDLEERLQEGSEVMNALEYNQQELSNTLEELSKKVNLLIESDKDDIKSFITREHHFFCYQQGWIDDYSLECCERRFSHYQQEGGNSFVGSFMNDLRRLPKQPLQEQGRNLTINKN